MAPGASTTFTYLLLYCSLFYPITPVSFTHLGTTHMGLALLLLLDLGGLVAHLSGTGQRSVDLASSTQTKDQMESRLLLNVVVREGATILQLLSSEDQTLLIWGNSLLVLDLGLDVLDGVRGLDIQSNRLS